APFSTTCRKDCTTGTGTHARTETVYLGTTAIIRLKSSLAHSLNISTKSLCAHLSALRKLSLPIEFIDILVANLLKIRVNPGAVKLSYPQKKSFRVINFKPIHFSYPQVDVTLWMNHHHRNNSSRTRGYCMSDELRITQLWNSTVSALFADARVTPQRHGFINLVIRKGVMAGTIYLEVPNDMTRDMFEQRLRNPLLAALGSHDTGPEVTNFAIVVNPDVEFQDAQPHYETEPEVLDTPVAVEHIETQERVSLESRI